MAFGRDEVARSQLRVTDRLDLAGKLVPTTDRVLICGPGPTGSSQRYGGRCRTLQRAARR